MPLSLNFRRRPDRTFSPRLRAYLYLGAGFSAFIAFAWFDLPYYTVRNAPFFLALRLLGLPVMLGGFWIARRFFPVWWGKANLLSRLGHVAFYSLFVVAFLSGLLTSVNAQFGVQTPVQVFGIVESVHRNRRGSGYATVIPVTGGRAMAYQITRDECGTLRPGDRYNRNYMRGSLGLLYRHR